MTTLDVGTVVAASTQNLTIGQENNKHNCMRICLKEVRAQQIQGASMKVVNTLKLIQLVCSSRGFNATFKAVHHYAPHLVRKDLWPAKSNDRQGFYIMRC